MLPVINPMQRRWFASARLRIGFTTNGDAPSIYFQIGETSANIRRYSVNVCRHIAEHRRTLVVIHSNGHPISHRTSATIGEEMPEK